MWIFTFKVTQNNSNSVPCCWRRLVAAMLDSADDKHFRPSREFYWRRQWHPTPVLLPGKSHGQRSLVGCRPWGRKESDMTERFHFHFSLSCIGEGNGNPLHCSCLENPRDGGAWWAAVYGVAQNRTRLKRLSSSSSMPFQPEHTWTQKRNLEDLIISYLICIRHSYPKRNILLPSKTFL